MLLYIYPKNNTMMDRDTRELLKRTLSMTDGKELLQMCHLTKDKDGTRTAAQWLFLHPNESSENRMEQIKA